MSILFCTGVYLNIDPFLIWWKRYIYHYIYICVTRDKSIPPHQNFIATVIKNYKFPFNSIQKTPSATLNELDKNWLITCALSYSPPHKSSTCKKCIFPALIENPKKKNKNQNTSRARRHASPLGLVTLRRPREQRIKKNLLSHIYIYTLTRETLQSTAIKMLINPLSLSSRAEPPHTALYSLLFILHRLLSRDAREAKGRAEIYIYRLGSLAELVQQPVAWVEEGVAFSKNFCVYRGEREETRRCIDGSGRRF